MAAIGADYRDKQACQESLQRRRESELVALWIQQWGQEHASVTLTCRREHAGKSRASECVNIKQKNTVITEAGGRQKENT